jgi:hypothetical protein
VPLKDVIPQCLRGPDVFFNDRHMKGGLHCFVRMPHSQAAHGLARLAVHTEVDLNSYHDSPESVNQHTICAIAREHGVNLSMAMSVVLR